MDKYVTFLMQKTKILYMIAMFVPYSYKEKFLLLTKEAKRNALLTYSPRSKHNLVSRHTTWHVIDEQFSSARTITFA